MRPKLHCQPLSLVSDRLSDSWCCCFFWCCYRYWLQLGQGHCFNWYVVHLYCSHVPTNLMQVHPAPTRLSARLGPRLLRPLELETLSLLALEALVLLVSWLLLPCRSMFDGVQQLIALPTMGELITWSGAGHLQGCIRSNNVHYIVVVVQLRGNASAVCVAIQNYQCSGPIVLH